MNKFWKKGAIMLLAVIVATMPIQVSANNSSSHIQKIQIQMNEPIEGEETLLQRDSGLGRSVLSIFGSITAASVEEGIMIAMSANSNMKSDYIGYYDFEILKKNFWGGWDTILTADDDGRTDSFSFSADTLMSNAEKGAEYRISVSYKALLGNEIATKSGHLDIEHIY